MIAGPYRSGTGDDPEKRLIQICDAVLRLPGESRGADNDVRLARERGLPVYFDIADVPSANEIVLE